MNINDIIRPRDKFSSIRTDHDIHSHVWFQAYKEIQTKIYTPMVSCYIMDQLEEDQEDEHQ